MLVTPRREQFESDRPQRRFFVGERESDHDHRHLRIFPFEEFGMRRLGSGRSANHPGNPASFVRVHVSFGSDRVPPVTT
jgi:hypothetical protein